jgi:acetate kinase
VRIASDIYNRSLISAFASADRSRVVFSSGTYKLPFGAIDIVFDPGVLIYLMDEYKMDAGAIEDLIYRKSGLLGVSGISANMRSLRVSSDAAAIEAIALFVHRIVREIGSLAAALGGLDALVFTAGIGENDPATRAEVSAGCRWLGLELDKSRNAAGRGLISSDASSVSAWVIPTDEGRMILRHTSSLLGLQEA